MEREQVIWWNDPDPIKGNCYLVQKLFYQGGGVALIHYGDTPDLCSEAEVPISELVFKDIDPHEDQKPNIK